ncbi:MAG: carbamoyltransferase HypF [Balneolales bacterium]|nr:carbamoyltransferase HypF [Balneolales bacterium]
MEAHRLLIEGIVQGVGFRPYVLREARLRQLKGWVRNSSKGLEILIYGTREEAETFLNLLLTHPPEHALITGSRHKTVQEQGEAEEEPEHPNTFRILESPENDHQDETSAGALLPPDRAICDRCRQELRQAGNRRNGYAFTTCLNCGPRYSVITGLSYDRARTTMAELPMCESCRLEYEGSCGAVPKEGPLPARQHSQTNSCPVCAIPMRLYAASAQLLTEDPARCLDLTANALEAGSTVAVKGVGGYLLLADACAANAVKQLRKQKNRPAKPFALMYPDIETVQGDAELSETERKALESTQAPIVLCRLRDKPASGLCSAEVAPGLNRIGIMLPYAPLLRILLQRLARPLIATSANLSGSPIIYRDRDALAQCGRFACLTLTFERDIMVPQDDSVIQFDTHGRRILLRRSRGLAPNHHPNPFSKLPVPVFAAGADLKNAFALADSQKLLVSQYLGNLASYESLENWHHVRQHLFGLYRFCPEVVLHDAHPACHSSGLAQKLAAETGAACVSIGHHESHFAALLAEHELHQSGQEVLGFIWDGTGYGGDGQIWGGEVMRYCAQGIRREVHLKYFPVLAGDRMSLEPRLSALSLLHSCGFAADRREKLLAGFFTEQEWGYYNKAALTGANGLQTSSMGRLIDAVSALLGLTMRNNYEAEAAMRLESLASVHARSDTAAYPLQLSPCGTQIDPRLMLTAICDELSYGESRGRIAIRFFRTLAGLVFQLSRKLGVFTLGFSGGVFQNALLCGMIRQTAGPEHRLLFHNQLSPNDENCGFGQIAAWQIRQLKQA